MSRRKSGLRLLSPCYVPLLATVGFELRSLSWWGLEDKAYKLTGVGEEGVLGGREANLAQPGTGDPDISPASPGSLAGHVDSAMGREGAGEKLWGSGRTRPPKALHHFSSSLTSGQVQG